MDILYVWLYGTLHGMVHGSNDKIKHFSFRLLFSENVDGDVNAWIKELMEHFCCLAYCCL